MRHEFTVAAKREMAERSGGRCEAVGGRAYGGRYDDLSDGERCSRPAEHYDHWPRPAHDPHPETRTAANGVHTCAHHNQRANNKIDTPREQKIKRSSYDHALHEARMARKVGLDAPDPPKPRGRQGKKPPPIRGRGFQKGSRPMPSKPFPKRTKP